MAGSLRGRLELRIPPLAVVALTALAMWAGTRAVPAAHYPLPGRTLLAVALAVAGGLVAAAGVRAFRRERTTVNPYTPAASSALVAAGIYRYSRNPMYLGFLLALAGWAVYLGNAVAWLGLPIFIAYLNAFQIVPEERALAARFGEAYEDYRRQVRRWL